MRWENKVWTHCSTTGEAPSERRTIYFIFTDPVLGAIEGVTVLRNSDLKQDARSCVRSVKIQKLYQSCMVSHQWNRQGRHHLPALRRLGLVAVGLFWVEVLWMHGYRGRRLVWWQRSF